MQLRCFLRTTFHLSRRAAPSRSYGEIILLSDIPGTPTEAPATLPAGLLPRADGLYIEAGGPAAVLMAAVNHVYASGAYLAGLDYAVLTKALYDVGPALPPLPGGMPLLRLATGVLPFAAERRPCTRAPSCIANISSIFSSRSISTRRRSPTAA